MANPRPYANVDIMETHLVSCIQENLAQYMYDNARWLAERLVAAAPNEPNIHLLATCYFQSNQAYRAYHLLKNSGASSPDARYLMALCCMQLGRLPEAKDALLKHGPQQVPQGAAGLYLLARVLRMLSLTRQAKEHLTAALRLNPLLWCAYEELCAMGADDEAGEVCAFADSCEQQLSSSTQQQQEQQQGAGIGSPPATTGNVPISNLTTRAADVARAGVAGLRGVGVGGMGRAGAGGSGSPGSKGSHGALAHRQHTKTGMGTASAVSSLSWPSVTPAAGAFTGGHGGAAHSGHLDTGTGGPGVVPGGAGGSSWMSGAPSSTPGWGGQGGGHGWDGLTPLPGPLFATPAGGSDLTTPAPGTAVLPADRGTASHHLNGGGGGGGLDSWLGGPGGGGTAVGHSPFFASTPSTGVSSGSATQYHMQGGPQDMGTDAPLSAGPMSMTGLAGPGRSLFGPGSGADEAGGFMTPALDGSMVLPPAPPRKHAASSQEEPSAPFPGFRAGEDAAISSGAGGAATPSTIGSGAYIPRGDGVAGPAHHHHAPRAVRLAVDDGKVRKVSGRALFPESVGPGGAGGAGGGGEGGAGRAGGAGVHGGVGGGVGGGGGGGGAYSPSRRSSRLAALAGGGVGAGGGSMSGGVGHRHRGGGGGGGGMGGGSRGWLHQSQNQPDPANPPAAPQQPQAVVDGKIGTSKLGRGQNSQTVLFASTLDMDGGHSYHSQIGAGGQHQHHIKGDMEAAGHMLSCGTGVRHSGLGQVRVLAMLHHAYRAYRHMAMYRSREALAEFQRLPPHQQHTAWVYIQVGRVLLERMEYHQAAGAFEAAHQLDRYRVEGLEAYSTVLWHLRRETDLSFLAQTAIATDRLAPQSWCVLGNLFSLHKEHDTALKLFERALQIDPSFTYAYTLSGHEYSASEELDKALACYRNALKVDPRHYNALYGMGCVCLRQEKYDSALCHFRSAVMICPRSSVLHCYVGMTLARQTCYDGALSKLQEAIDLDPKNPLARYEKAGVLVSLGDCEAALTEFRTLAHLAPGEASVYLQMGKLYKRLGQLSAAQRQLELALSFTGTSGDAAAVKAAIDKLNVNDEGDEEEL